MAIIGYTTIGANTTGIYINGSQLGSKFTCGTTGTYTTMYVRGFAFSGTVNFKVAIYTDTAGIVGNLVSESGATAGTWTTSEAWVSCGNLSANLTSGTEYWLIVSANGDFLCKYDVGAVNQTMDDFTSYGNFPSSYPTADNYYTAVISIYAESIDALTAIAWVSA